MTPYFSRDGIQLFHGDCREVMPSLADESIDMIWTDPPYGHGNMDGDLQAARIRDGVKGGRFAEAEPIANDSGEDFEAVIDAFLEQAARVLNRDCCCCCCCCCGGGGPNPTFATIAQKIDAALEFFHAVVWDKSARGNGMGWRYRRNYEFVMVAHRKGGKLLWAEDDFAVPNIVRYSPVIDRLHPNEKPLAMVRDFIRWHTRKTDLILDPFAGSGTTLRAAMDLGRRAIGIEVDEEWCERAAAKLEQKNLQFTECLA